MARALKQNWLSTLCDLALESPGQYCPGIRAPVHWTTALQAAARPPIEDTGSLSPPYGAPSLPPVLLHHHQDEEEGQVDGMMTATMMVRPQPMEHYVPEPRRLLLRVDDDDGAEEDRDGDADDEEEERTNSRQVRCQRRRASGCSSTRAGRRRTGRRQGGGRGRGVSDVNLLRSIYASIACNARRAAVTPLCAARQRLSWAMAATATITSSSSPSIRCAHAFTEQSQYRLFIVGHTSR